MNCLQHGRRAGKRLASTFLLIVFLLANGTASAFIDPPVLIPANPLAGQTISISIRHGDCDGFHAVPPQITRVGNAIRMLLATSHYDDPLFCNSPVSTAIFEVGSFPPGSYVLHVERFYDTAVPEPVYETLAVLEFEVGSGAPAALPASGLIGSLLLIAGILAAVAFRLVASRLPGSLLLLLAIVSPSIV